MSVVTIDDVRLALEKALSTREFSHEEIIRLSEKLMDLFGFTDQVVDNRLTPADRDMFYLLEEVGLVTTIHDEVQVEKGKTWRIYYWILKKDQIARLASEFKEQKDQQVHEDDIYETISDDVWKHHQDA